MNGLLISIIFPSDEISSTMNDSGVDLRVPLSFSDFDKNASSMIVVLISSLFEPAVSHKVVINENVNK